MARKPQKPLAVPLTLRVTEQEALHLHQLAHSQKQSINKLLTPVIQEFVVQHQYLLRTSSSRR